MDFLAICKQAAAECGITSGGPASVANQSGLLARIVNWVAQSYEELQQAQAWRFLWRRDSGTLTAGKSTYTATELGIPTLGLIYARRMVIDQGGRRARLEYRDPHTLLDADARTGTPAYFTRLPSDELMFWPTPDATFQVVVEHLRAPHSLLADTDVPIIPRTSLHPILVWRAVERYGMHVEDAAAAQRARDTGDDLYQQLASLYAPSIDARPLPIDAIPDNEGALV